MSKDSAYDNIKVNGPSEAIDSAGASEAHMERHLKAAYDSMDPTPEQESRMLDALLEAQAARESKLAEDAEGKGASPASQEPGASVRENRSAANTPSPNRARAFKGWKIAVPIAACLAVGAVLVGVANMQPSVQASPVASPSQPEVAQVESARAPSASATAAPAGEEAQAKTNNTLMPELTTGAGAYEGADDADMLYEAEPGLYGVMANEAMVDDGYYFDEFNTEEYSAVKETGFISTKANPLSTVSADVDTASYCNVRRMINDGYSLADIPSGSVRIEEMLNYFHYDYANPAPGELFSMQAQSAPCPWNPDTQLLVLGFAAAEENTAASKGSNLVFLVDVSGSMDSPDKLDLLQDSFATLLDSLTANDRVSIVTYASGEEIVLEGASGDDDKAILKAIYKLQADGSTNGEAGLAQAYEVAQRNFIEGGVNRIIMASDGDLNVGMTSESDLYDFVDAKRGTGIYLSVLGFGSGNYKDNKMETLADHGNGSYHYIDCIEEAERVLKDKLTANLVPFADDVKVQVEFNPAQVKGYRLIGYENRELADEDFRNDEVDAGDVGPGSQFTVAYEIVPANSKMEIAEPELKYGAQAEASGSGDTGDAGSTGGTASSEWLTCTMRYHAFDGDEMREQQLPVDAASASATPDANWNLAAAVIEFGMIARDSDYKGTSSEDEILELLANATSNDDASSFKRLALSAL